MTETKTLLREEIHTEFEKLKAIETGSESYKTTVDGLTKLIDRETEMEKFEADKLEKIERQKQAKDEKIDRWVRNGISLAGILLPLGVTIWGTVVSLKFETEGSVTSMIGRGFINKLLPKK